MTTEELPSGPSRSLINEVADWLMDQALGNTDARTLLEKCSLRLSAAGLPLSRTNIGFQILHPLYQAESHTWHRQSGMEPPTHFSGGADSLEETWRRSPAFHMIENGIPVIRRRLTGPDAVVDFDFLADLRDQGATDYLGYLELFGSTNFVSGEQDGIIGSWVTDRAGGFADEDIQALRRIQRRLAVACKMTIREQITRNVLSAYMGPDAGRQVLRGNIQLGDGESIHAVIWFSDLRQSTVLADRLAPEQFLETVNNYFECTAGSVLANGGEVLRFIGDAVLGIFPIREDGFSETEACENALAAAAEAETRMDALNGERAKSGQDDLGFGLGLHLGDVIYGNIGVPERVEFSVIGPAANEVARLEDLTKVLERRVLVSESFAQALDRKWESLGVHALRGVGEPMEVFAAFRAHEAKAAE